MDFSATGERYTRDYFFREYRNQYGRTYLEDAAHIRNLARPRLERIRRLLKLGGSKSSELREKAGENLVEKSKDGRVSGPDSNNPHRLLDVGCAYGPFLQAAARSGFEVTGVDISEDAAAYVRDHLGYAAFAADFSSESDPGSTAQTATEEESSFEQSLAERFDVITMWFVIEHFARLDIVLERVYRLLRPGGVFCFSTPNERGISGRKNPEHFLRSSPRDHHSVWNPSSAARVLNSYGFRLVKTVSTGHHPERFPFVGRKRGALFHFTGLASRMFGMGDTFEVYAEKIDGVGT